LNLRLRGRGRRGIYHSIYDDFKWYTTFGRYVVRVRAAWRRRSVTGGDAARRRRKSMAYQFTAFGGP